MSLPFKRYQLGHLQYTRSMLHPVKLFFITQM